MHGLTQAEDNGPWLSGAPVHVFSSAMAQAFGVAIIAWTTCFVVTLGVSFITAPKPEAELRGLVYSLTERPDARGQGFWQSPWVYALIVLVLAVFFNILFF